MLLVQKLIFKLKYKSSYLSNLNNLIKLIDQTSRLVGGGSSTLFYLDELVIHLNLVLEI